MSCDEVPPLRYPLTYARILMGGVLSPQAEGGTSQQTLAGFAAGFAARLDTEHVTPPDGDGRGASEADFPGTKVDQEAEGGTDRGEVQLDTSPPDATPPDAQLRGREEEQGGAEATADHTEQPAKQVSAETYP